MTFRKSFFALLSLALCLMLSQGVLAQTQDPDPAQVQAWQQLTSDASTEASTTLAEDAGGATNWGKLFGIALGLVADGSEAGGYTIKLQGGPNQRLQGSVALQAPTLRDAVKEAFDEDQEAAALRGLGPWDDMKFEIKFQLGKKVAARKATENAIARQSVDLLASPVKIREMLSSDQVEKLLPSFADTSSSRDENAASPLRSEVLAVQAAELLTFQRQAERALLSENQAVSRKPHTFSLTASYRLANKLVGQDSIEAGFDYAYRTGGRSNDEISSGDEQLSMDERMTATAAGFLDDCMRNLGSRSSAKQPKWFHTIDVKGTYGFKKEISGQEVESLNLAKFQELKITGSWALKPRISAKKDQDLPGKAADVLPLAGNTLSFSYIKPNEDFANERWIISNTFDLNVGESKTLPFTLSWSNQDEFVKGDVVRGHFGFSFDKAR